MIQRDGCLFYANRLDSLKGGCVTILFKGGVCHCSSILIPCGGCLFYSILLTCLRGGCLFDSAILDCLKGGVCHYSTLLYKGGTYSIPFEYAVKGRGPIPVCSTILFKRRVCHYSIICLMGGVPILFYDLILFKGKG